MNVQKQLRPELMAKLANQYDGKTTSLGYQTTRYDHFDIKLKNLFGQDEQSRYQRIATWIQQQGRYHTAALEKDYTEAQSRYKEAMASGGAASLSKSEIGSGRTNTETVEGMVAQNPNAANGLEYITEIDEGSITPGYKGIVNPHIRDKDALRKYYGIEKPGNKDYNATDVTRSDTLDLRNNFDVQRAFIMELIGKAKKKQQMYQTAYIR